ncbi:MAG TPA: prolyl oligopeptidase family serine peptidase [Cyclobacteriaceae bacterium]|nr:prolyl oligopeptidase family serine peptidase [Cyclobacteriaceae bacterium]HRK55330.1 prolyl oligopeptidase family serine peptidase [Cyclobacteriaceae bacterium]
MRIIVFILSSLAVHFACAQTLDQFLSHPVSSGLAYSANGQLAWIVNDQGQRNIFIRSNGTTQQLTRYAEDDGQELSDLLFSSNGNLLVYVRGGAANRYGQNPNPASMVEGAEQAIWCIATTPGSEPFRLANGSNPILVGNNKIVFSRGGQLFTIALEKNSLPEPLFSARGSNGSQSLSPDGSRILFVSDRGDHAFIGVYHLTNKKIQWIAPDIGNDAFPVWSPDGKKIGFLRMPGTRVDELPDLTGGVKFSVWVADATLGKASSIWDSPADDGGFAQYYSSTPLSWSKSNRILFFSEHEGWNHVYAIDPDGSNLKDITPGDGIVESYSYNEDETSIYFDGNREDVDRRHIWMSNVKEGKPVAITSGVGIEMYPQWAIGSLYCFQSTYNTSLTLMRYDSKTKNLESIDRKVGASFSSKGFVMPEQVIMKAADGTTVHGQLFIDRKQKGKKPGLVFMHGGPIRQMLLGFHYSEYYINAYAFNQHLASQGYAVLSVNYRDGIGYGRDFRRAKDQGPRGASEYQDVVAAGNYLKTLQEVDPAKIGLWGGSYGGYLTAMGLARNPELFKAGVDLHGVHDWAFRAREFSPGGSWGIGEKDMALAYQSSPVSDLSKWTAPVLFVHGDDDRNVLFQQTIDLAEKLRDKKVDIEILVLPDEVHGFLRYESWKQVFDATKDFFDRKLKK